MKPSLKKVKARQIQLALIKDGFRLSTKKGGHLIYRNPAGRRVVLSFHHSGDTFPPKTLKAMLIDAGWDEEDIKRLGLLKSRHGFNPAKFSNLMQHF